MAVKRYDGSAWQTVAGLGAQGAAGADGTAPLTTKGDILTYGTAATRLAVGNNGETLVADSSATTGLRWQGNFAAGKNKIINGDFNIWQRGTSFTLTSTADTYTADRWRVLSVHSAGTASASQQSFTAGTAPVAGYESQYFLRLTAGSAGSPTAYLELLQKIEDVRTFANQTITVSFWAKASVSTTITPVIQQNFGSGGSTTVTTNGSNISVTTSWTRFSQTFSVPSISGKTIGAGNWLGFYPIANNVTNSQTVDFWGVQVEAGNVATAFQTATGTLAGELAACQRYFWRFTNSTANPSYVGIGTYYSTTACYIVAQWPVPMRIAPTITNSSATGWLAQVAGTQRNSTAVAVDVVSANYADIYITTAADTAGRSAVVGLLGGASNYFEASAEL